ncbi:probable chitinase 10 [Anastrepha obliqua]|uniref:probable chitinase 10 n=1 Tax=Anastrepha obliqua TaxID=95512 RepID=UPI002409D63E|nr:probable chitinase 10 [Anastrepha obliqua]
MYTKFGKTIFLLLFINHIRAEPFKECKHAIDGTFVAIENNCLAYIYCMGDNSFTDLCPAGTYFDQQQQQCTDDTSFKCSNYTAAITGVVEQQSESAQQQSTILATLQHNTANTLSSVLTTEATDALSSETRPNILPQRPHCKPTVDEYFPHRLRCEYYYRCTRGYLSILRCNFGYGWDFLREKCLPLKEAQCYRVAETLVFKF